MCVHVAIQMICLGISGVIFVRHNYNFNIPAVAYALSKRYREIRRNSYVNLSHKEIKDDKYSKNVQIRSHVNHEQHS